MKYLNTLILRLKEWQEKQPTTEIGVALHQHKAYFDVEKEQLIIKGTSMEKRDSIVYLEKEEIEGLSNLLNKLMEEK